MADRVKDKVMIVTGSTMGIGRAVAALLLEEGAQVVLNSHQDDPHAASVRHELGGPNSLYVRADIADRAQVEALVAQTLARFGRVDAVINNAGMNVFTDPLEMTAGDWQRCFAVDLEGAWNVIRAVLPAMLERSYGNIVNIASVHGHKIIPAAFRTRWPSMR